MSIDSHNVGEMVLQAGKPRLAGIEETCPGHGSVKQLDSDPGPPVGSALALSAARGPC